ncbi:MAG: lactate utilization protein [Thermovirgaceae bacterium]|nr:lactate utilization protein [Thermovirgaceae bacterium]
MNDIKAWHNDVTGAKVVEALQGNGFEAVYCKSRSEAAAEILRLIPEPVTVGLGGSRTIGELGVVETLKERGNTILDHSAPGLSNEERMQVRRGQLTCGVFLTGSNAVTMDGRLVNTDGNGNRVAAMIFGPGKVIVVAGINKVVRDVAEAEDRIRRVAAPMNNKRLNLPNPCVKTGVCMDCQGPTRICNVTTILNKRPGSTEMHVIIVGEELGF